MEKHLTEQNELFKAALNVFNHQLNDEKVIANNLFSIACHKVAKATGIDIDQRFEFLSIETLNNQDFFNIRTVNLTAEWWLYDVGPLLAFKNDNYPMVLIPHSFKGYWLIDPKTNHRTEVTQLNAKELKLEAISFYKPYSDDSITYLALFKLSWKNSKIDFLKILSLQMLMGILLAIIPIATATLFSSTVTDANYDNLLAWVWGLIVIIIIYYGFNYTAAMTELHLRYKTNYLLQSGLWDRITRLPVNFFKYFTAGDLATRAIAFDLMQQHFARFIIQVCLNALFTFIPLVVMFYFSKLLSASILILSAIMFLIYSIYWYQQLGIQRKLNALRGKIVSSEYQLINGILKLKVSCREEHYFKFWSRYFLQSISYVYNDNLRNAKINLFNSLHLPLSFIIIFMLTLYLDNNLSFADFVGFNAALALFLGNISNLLTSMTKIITIFPLAERARPILIEKPQELHQAPMKKFTLKGDIKIKNLHFSYQKNKPILKNINLTINAGEFIGITGPSGSGKSTLLRLLIGFEQKQTGDIFFDNIRPEVSNFKMIRNQFGVVLQSDQLIPGSILENINIHQHLSLSEIWNVLTLVDLKEEIENMPLGIHTFIMEKAKSISTGQKQRILLARTLLSQPKILFLDEAMSALDNISHHKIIENLSNHKITQVIITQRPSSLKAANRIYVFDHGQIVQSGTFVELTSTEGLFKSLVNNEI